MDLMLSQFITRTSAEAGLARDLLECHKWDLQSALNAYYVMKGLVSPNDGNDYNDDDNSECDVLRSSPSMVNRPLSYVKDAYNNRFALINGTKSEKFDAPHIVTIKCSSEPSLSSPSSVSNCSNDSSTNSSPSKLAISKSDDSPADIIDVCVKKLSRGISRATDNVNLVTKARNEFAMDFRTSCRGSRLLNTSNFLEAPDFTFTLPDLSIHPEDFRVFLEQDLIEKSTLLSLESAGRLNWWSDLGVCQKLWPLATTGDGNCLLHAASLGMWGFHDRLLTLRKALHALLSNSSYTTAFYRRWRWQTSLQNREAGLVFSEDEWRREWECLLRMASSEPRVRAQMEKSTELNGGKKNDDLTLEPQPHVYESLEEIHIFALSHVLRRPIIVIADTMLKDITGEAFFPIPFGGIYLPLECPSSMALMKSPLCLTYDAAHFSALVAMDKETYVDKTPHPPAAIPLSDSEHNILPLQFAIDPGEDVTWKKGLPSDDMIKRLTLSEKDKLNLLRDYFDITHIKLPPNETDLMIEKQSAKRSSKILEKSRTLPCSFESDDSSDAATCGSASSVSANAAIKSSKAFSSKAAKQILMITKHFGSLGRMSKRIKKNLGTLARRGTSFRSKSGGASPTKKCELIEESAKINDKAINTDSEKKETLNGYNGIFDDSDSIVAAVLHTEKRHEYHDEMIRNYLNTARARFLRQLREKKSSEKQNTESPSSLSTASSASTNSTSTNTSSHNTSNTIAQCVNTGCKMYGTAATNYLCSSCFADQKLEITKNNTNKTHICDKESDCDNPTNDSKSYHFNNILHEDNDVKVLTSSSPKSSKKDTEDIVISCANSHFYVATST